MLVDLLQRCWQKDPALRPTFAEIVDILNSIKEVRSTQRYTCILSVFFLILCFFFYCQVVQSSGHHKRHSGRSHSGRRRGCWCGSFVLRLCFVAFSHVSSLIAATSRPCFQKFSVFGCSSAIASEYGRMSFLCSFREGLLQFFQILLTNVARGVPLFWRVPIFCFSSTSCNTTLQMTLS